MLYGSWNNYISTLRKQSGLTQDELAMLLDLDGRSTVSRYERTDTQRLPDLKTVLALELVFEEPIQRIFAGVAEKVRRETAARARAMLQGMTDKPNAQNAQKLETLAHVAQVDEEDFTPWRDAA